MKIKQQKSLTFYSEHLLFRQSCLSQWLVKVIEPPLEYFILTGSIKCASKESL